MASKFSSAEDICEGGDCKAIADLTFYVTEKKKLCKDCASKKGCIIKARKGLPDLYCKKHDKDIDLYCKTDGVACCYSCAMIDHNKQPCVQQGIEEAIKENRTILIDLKKRAMDKLELCRLKGDRIHQCRRDADKHLQDMKTDVDSVIADAIKMDQDREREEAAKVDLEIDEKNEKLQEEIRKINEKIRKNNEERKKLHELIHTNAEKRRQPIDNKQRSLHDHIESIAKETERKIGDLEKSCQDDAKTKENTVQTLDTVLENNQNVVKDGHRVITLVTDELDKPLDEHDEDEVKHITRTVSGVRFVKGAGREKYNGRIDVYDGEWKLIDKGYALHNLSDAVVVGYIDECNVLTTHPDGSIKETYMRNMKYNRRVFSSDTSCITSCALLNDDKVVCGKTREGCTGNSLTGCISVYDKQWKLINDVTIPRHTTKDATWVNVAADQDGMIIAAEMPQTSQSQGLKQILANSISVGYKMARNAVLGQYNAPKSRIYVINPADGTIMNTITCKQEIWMRGVLSSGHIIAHPFLDDHKMFIIDREGAQKEITHSDEILNVCIDPVTDDLYIVTSDDEYKTCVIDQVMSGGNMKKRRVASFPLATRITEEDNRLDILVYSRVLMTSSGKMIACDGESILIYKKVFDL